jgi:magnesium transporter
MSFEVTKDIVQSLKDAIKRGNNQLIQENLHDVHAADVSLILAELSVEETKHIIHLLDKPVAADILSNMEKDLRDEFLDESEFKEIASWLDYFESDDAANVLREQPIRVREEILLHMTNKEKVKNILDLIPFEEDSAGGLMAKELIKTNVNWTIKQTIEEIRRQAQKVDKILTVYVVDDNEVLLGRVSVKVVILSKDDTHIKDIYIPDIHAVQTFSTPEEVAEIMQKYDLEAVPVVNVNGQLVGRITIDDVVDIIKEQAETDQQIMAGITESVEVDDTIWVLSRARLPWLIIGMIGGLIGANLIGVFENQLVLIPAMAFFIPLITATGGNVGIQSSTLIVQAIANDSFEGSGWKEIVKTFMVAILNGLVIAFIVFGFNAFSEDIRLAFVVSIALFCVVLLASFTGTITPILLNRFGVNPAIASGPFITTANDLLGLAVYFSVAKLLYSFA